MDWKPITKNQLMKIISKEEHEIPQTLYRRYLAYKVDPYKIDCIRSNISGLEQVFVVAKKDNKLIIYDDVEDEFCITSIPFEGELREWSSYQELQFAVRDFL